MKLNLRELEGFRETLLTGSVTAAAGRMGLSQPAVSRLIAQLEQELGFPLFYRDRGRLSPTPEGQQLFEEVDLAFSAFDRIGNLATDLAGLHAGALKIVAPPSFSEGALSEILARFMTAHPRVHVSIDSRSQTTARNMVANRAADCGFVKLPMDRSDLHTQLLSRSETVCVLPAGHRLASETELTPQLLKGEALIMLGLGSASRAQIDAAFTSQNVRPRIQIEAHTVGSACAFAARGLGIAIVNELMAPPYVGPGMALRVFRPSVPHEYAFMTSALGPPTRLAQALLEVSREYFAGLSHQM